MDEIKKSTTAIKPTNIEDFNKFLKENIEYIKSITPINPSISIDDEWRTDDYSEYEK